MSRFLYTLLIVSALALGPRGDAGAQDTADRVQARIDAAIERVPALAQLRDKGATVVPLGRAYGLDGWLARGPGGGVEIYYSTPDGAGLVKGLLFATDGSSETQRQLAALQDGDIDLSAILRDGEPPLVSGQSPGETFLADSRNADWIGFGPPGAPPLYLYVDTRCPFCARLWRNLARGPLADGAVQLRLIPVAALGPESLRQAARLLEAEDPAAAWRRLMAGDEAAVAGKPGEEAVARVHRNSQLILRWNIEGTPFAVYRDRAGEVAVVNGEPADLTALIADLGSEWPDPG